MKINIETIYRIRNDDDKTWIEISPDENGFGDVELRKYNEDGKVVDRFDMDIEEAPAVARFILKVVDEIKGNKQ